MQERVASFFNDAGEYFTLYAFVYLLSFSVVYCAYTLRLMAITLFFLFVFTVII